MSIRLLLAEYVPGELPTLMCTEVEMPALLHPWLEEMFEPKGDVGDVLYCAGRERSHFSCYVMLSLRFVKTPTYDI